MCPTMAMTALELSSLWTTLQVPKHLSKNLMASSEACVNNHLSRTEQKEITRELE